MAELSIYTTQTPDRADSNSPAGQRELGTAFQSSVDTWAVAMSFYAGTTAPVGGDPVGELWSVATPNASTGTLLTSASRTAASVVAGTRNRINFSAPVFLAAGAWFVVSAWLPDHYAYRNPNPFPITNGTLSTADGTSTGGNGRFSNGVGPGNLPQVQIGSTGYDFMVDIITDPTAGVVVLRRPVVVTAMVPPRTGRAIIVMPAWVPLTPVVAPAAVVASPRPVPVPGRAVIVAPQPPAVPAATTAPLPVVVAATSPPPRPGRSIIVFPQTADTTPPPPPPAPLPVVVTSRLVPGPGRATTWSALPDGPAAPPTPPVPVPVIAPGSPRLAGLTAGKAIVLTAPPMAPTSSTGPAPVIAAPRWTPAVGRALVLTAPTGVDPSPQLVPPAAVVCTQLARPLPGRAVVLAAQAVPTAEPPTGGPALTIRALPPRRRWTIGEPR